MRICKSSAKFVSVATTAMTLFLWCAHADAFVYKVLHSFGGGRDGSYPSGGLSLGADGNLYGTTISGGNTCDCGTIYKVTPRGKETIVYRFRGGHYGSGPTGELVQDNTGNLFGISGGGGSSACGDGCGTVFRISASGTHKVMHAFAGTSDDGAKPGGDLIRDSAGNLYGTTGVGGGSGCHFGSCGTVYRVGPTGVFTLLYAFQGGSNGDDPIALVRDSAGNLYGTTFFGGKINTPFFPDGMGTVFELTPDRKEKILHAFDAATEGFEPDTGLFLDAHGNLYGGTYGRDAILYRLSPAGALTTLYQLNADDANGWFPFGAPLIDGEGNFFINNHYGGSSSDPDCGDFRCGTIFELAADGTPSARHQFGAWAQDGFRPVGNLVMSHNRIYGVTYTGGQYLMGTVWVLNL